MTEDTIRRTAIEDGHDPDAPLVEYELTISVRAVRECLQLSQDALAITL